MINRLPLTVGFARVSQATEDQGNLETQTRQLQDHGVHELVTEIGSGARSDRRALRDLQARLHAGDTLVELPHRNAGMGEAVGRDPGVDGKSKGEEGMTEAYCFKCRTKQEIEAPQDVTLKNGRPATTGKCPACGRKLFRMVSWSDRKATQERRDRHVRGSGGLAPGNRQPVCTQGGAAARVSKWGPMTPENGAMGRENGLALFLHRFTGNLASIS